MKFKSLTLLALLGATMIPAYGSESVPKTEEESKKRRAAILAIAGPALLTKSKKSAEQELKEAYSILFTKGEAGLPEELVEKVFSYDKIWKCEHVLKLTEHYSKYIRAMAYHKGADGDIRLVVADGEQSTWNTKTGQCESYFPGHKLIGQPRLEDEPVKYYTGVDGIKRAVMPWHNNAVLIFFTKETRIKEKRNEEHSLKGHEKDVNCVAVYNGHDGIPRIISGSGDKTVRIWNTQTYACESVIGVPERVNCVMSYVGPDGKIRIVSGGGDTVRIWNCDGPDAFEIAFGVDNKRNPQKES